MDSSNNYLNQRGQDLIKGFEQCRLTAYKDSGGVWTIGWGHTGPEVVEGLTCEQAEADVWFLQDVGKSQLQVQHCVDTALTTNQYNALVSFEYNTGALEHSTLLVKLNAGDYLGAAKEFPKWNHVKGKVVDGLTKRRLAEQALFMAWD